MRANIKRVLALAVVLCLVAPGVGMAEPIPDGFPYPEKIEAFFPGGSVTVLSTNDTDISCQVPVGTTSVEAIITPSPNGLKSETPFSSVWIHNYIPGQRLPVDLSVGDGNLLFMVWGTYENSDFYVSSYVLTITADGPALPQPPTPSTSSTPTAETPKPNYAHGTIAHCREWVNVRSGPGTEYEIIGRAYLGEALELMQWDRGFAWCKVIYNGGNSAGWVFGRFVTPK